VAAEGICLGVDWSIYADFCVHQPQQGGCRGRCDPIWKGLALCRTQECTKSALPNVVHMPIKESQQLYCKQHSSYVGSSTAGVAAAATVSWASLAGGHHCQYDSTFRCSTMLALLCARSAGRYACPQQQQEDSQLLLLQYCLTTVCTADSNTTRSRHRLLNALYAPERR
jgi:hypothetical protein